MRCNACWRELEGQAISTTCGHLFCTEDASKILSNDAVCPICDQVLSKSLMRPVDINPGDEWINMSMAGVSPQILMRSAYKSIMFYVGQKELEMQFKMNKIVGQCRQKCEALHEKFTEKLEQVHTAYQKLAKRSEMMEKEIESLSKDKQELQEKYAEKSRQKRKLDEMYDKLRCEYESVKRCAIQPANFFPRGEPDLFSSMANVVDTRDNLGQDRSVFTPETPGRREEIWPSIRQKNSSTSAFEFSGGSPAKTTQGPVDMGTRMQTGPVFGAGARNPGATLRNLIISPMKRPQLSRNHHPHIFTPIELKEHYDLIFKVYESLIRPIKMMFQVVEREGSLDCHCRQPHYPCNPVDFNSSLSKLMESVFFHEQALYYQARPRKRKIAKIAEATSRSTRAMSEIVFARRPNSYSTKTHHPSAGPHLIQSPKLHLAHTEMETQPVLSFIQRWHTC